MGTFIREGGWPMWPVLIVGAISIAVAARYVVAPRVQLLPNLAGLGLLTILLGVLGTALGVQASAEYIDRVDDSQRWIFLLGLRESLNNLVAALVIVAIDTLVVTLGSAFRSRPEPTITSAA